MAPNTILFVVLHLFVYGLVEAVMCNNNIMGSWDANCTKHHRIDPTWFTDACFIRKEFKTGEVKYSCSSTYDVAIKKNKRNECLIINNGQTYEYVCETANCNTRTVCNGWFKDDQPVTNPVPAPAPGASAPAPAPGAPDAAPNAPAPPPSPKSAGTRCDGLTLALLMLLFGVYFTV